MRQIAAVLQFPIEEGSINESNDVRQLKAIVDELRGLLEDLKAAKRDEIELWDDRTLAVWFTDRGIKCSELTIVRERRAGKIRFKRVAGKACYTRKHVEEYLASSN